MNTLRRTAAILLIGTLITDLIAIAHITTSIRIGGADGIRLPSWTILAATPLALAATLALDAAGRHLEHRQAARRAHRNTTRRTRRTTR